MACTEFTPAKNIFKCTQTLQIGVIEANKAVHVYFQRINSNHIYKIEATSDVDGLLTVTIEDLNWFRPLFKYNVWVSDPAALSPDEPLVITLEENEYFGFQFGVENVVGADSKIVIDDCVC
ncbi:MAG: hypothetical protein V4687_16145 [Bacteroidota bacterium]